MIKVEVWYEPNSGNTITDILEFEDDATQEEMEDAFDDWVFDQFSSGWRIQE